MNNILKKAMQNPDIAKRNNIVVPESKPVHQWGVMNGLEKQFYQELLSYSEILLFEKITLRLAKGLSYTPDFIVISDNRIYAYEVKGFWRDDARAKIKMAAEMFPMIQFVAVQYHKKQWEYERFGSSRKEEIEQALED